MKSGCGCLSCIGCLTIGLVVGVALTMFFYPKLREKGWTFEQIIVETGDKVMSALEPDKTISSNDESADEKTPPQEPEEVSPPMPDNQLGR